MSVLFLYSQVNKKESTKRINDTMMKDLNDPDIKYIEVLFK